MTMFLIIEAVNGKKISGYTEFSDQNEVILRFRTQFRVRGNSLHSAMSTYIAHLKEIDEDNDTNLKWKQNAITLARRINRGHQLNKLSNPIGKYIDEDQYSMYIVDFRNDLIVKWTFDTKEGIIVAGGKEGRNNFKQLSLPQGLIVNEIDDVYVADSDNHRIMCSWPLGSKEVRLVVGGNDRGHESNQLKQLMCLSFDRENNLIVVDCENHRIQRFDVDIRN